MDVFHTLPLQQMKYFFVIMVVMEMAGEYENWFFRIQFWQLLPIIIKQIVTDFRLHKKTAMINVSNVHKIPSSFK